MSDTITIPTVEVELKPGATLFFGKPSTLWRVLEVDREHDTALLIAEREICRRQYHGKWENVDWEHCNLRAWLYHHYYSMYFTGAEKDAIVETHLTNPNNPRYGTPGGNDTTDFVFLLSIDEANKYFKNNADRATGSSWWLRSPGPSSSKVAHVYEDGHVDNYGSTVGYGSFGVRPAFKISLKSDIFQSFILSKSEKSITLSVPQFAVNGGVLTESQKSITRAEIPEGVISIREGVFAGRNALESVILPASLKVIGKEAFRGCSALKEVTIPEGVTKIGDRAFSNCTGLKKVTILGKDTDFSDAEKVFDCCVNLESFIINEKLKKLGKEPFGTLLPGGLLSSLGDFDRALTDGDLKRYILNKETWGRMQLPEKVRFFMAHRTKGLSKEYAGLIDDSTAKQIGAEIAAQLTGKVPAKECTGAVYYMTTLDGKISDDRLYGIYTKLKAEKNGAKALAALEETPALLMRLHNNEGNELAAKEAAGLLALKEFKIEKGVLQRYIGKSTEVVIPEGLNITAIGDEAFKDFDKITSVTIPEGVTSIGENAFYGCMALKKVTIPESIKTFGKRAFVFCSNLECITIPGGAESVSFGMFGYCNSLKNVTISEGVKRIDYGAFIFCRSLETVEIPKSIESIGEWAFQDCSSLKKVIIPESLTAIDEGAFICCNRLTDAAGFVIVNNILFDYVPRGREAVDLVIPDSVARISCRVFLHCDKVKSIRISESVTSIGEWAFRDCSQLRSITIPQSVTHIGKWAFLGCDKLADVTLCAKLTMDELKEAHLYKSLDESAMNNLISRANASEDKEAKDQFYRSYLLSDTRAAMLLAEKRKELDKYAALRGMNVYELRDRYLPDLGLDMHGRKSYDLGNITVTVQMNPDFSFTVELPDGKTAKSLPKKGSDPEKYSVSDKDLSQMRKDSRRILKNRADLLLADFISGKERTAEYWADTYGGNPILHAMACLLVWEQGGKTFRRTDDGLITADGSAYELTDEPVRVAHPIETEEAELEAWRKHFTSRTLKQPFAQIWERAYDPSEIAPDRYAGCPIIFFQLQGAEKHGFNQDLNIPGCKVEAKWSTETAANGNKVSYCDIQSFTINTFSRAVNHALAYLDRVTIAGRIAKDDADVMRSVEGSNVAQVTEYIGVAQEAGAVNVLALLLEYKNTHFADFDPMDEFTLE